MYRRYISKAEYDRIVVEYSSSNTPPHCNERMFHKLGICAFCDGYYRLNPDFKPATYVSSEANGWGGNMAPIVDDELAAEERAEWDKIFERFK